MLVEADLTAVLVGDDYPGVPSGAWEVRVPPTQVARADSLIAANAEAPKEEGDPSHDLDTEVIFDAIGATAEMEALGIRAVLEANEISSVLVGASVYPNLRFVVRVAKKDAQRAQDVLAEAAAAGPAAAEEAASSSTEPAPE
jgi:hypothetical protein